jgi:nucleoside-diphosphate-sugar epimerase
MLTHLRSPEEKPGRAVVLGAAGFVGAASLIRLKAAGIQAVGLGRGDVDLTSAAGAEALRKLLLPGDTLLFVSARAPCRNASMLIENVRMAETVCTAIKGAAVAHLVYVSSDAVYKDSADPLTEASCAEPGSTHGAMHLAREVILRSEYPGPLAIVRPTLIYGLHDPHNGYGPNRFRRLASAGADIVLFGNGEERRDHVHVDDVAGLICRIVQRGSYGTLNAVSGGVASFRELAEFTVEQFSPRVTITTTPRTGPIPHNGYRPFDAAGITRAFPDFAATPWREGIASTCKALATD